MQAIKQENWIQYYPSQVRGISGMVESHSDEEYVRNIQLPLSLIKRQIRTCGRIHNLSTIRTSATFALGRFIPGSYRLRSYLRSTADKNVMAKNRVPIPVGYRTLFLHTLAIHWTTQS
jgi:hypothetical protein